MVNRMDRHGYGDKDARKDELNRLFVENGMSEKEIVDFLQQILDQRKDVQLVKDCAKKAGLRLERFITNKALALYFDVYRGKRTVGYISKGWSDPGFRIGDIIELNKTMPLFKGKFYDIYKICSKELISVHVSEKDKDMIIVDMEIGIYRGGLNAGVFRKAIKNLYDAMRIVRLSMAY